MDTVLFNLKEQVCRTDPANYMVQLATDYGLFDPRSHYVVAWVGVLLQKGKLQCTVWIRPDIMSLLSIKQRASVVSWLSNHGWVPQKDSELW